MKSERINLLVSAEEKSQIDANARAAGLTTSELVRRAVLSFDPTVDMDELSALSGELAALAERLQTKLDDGLEELAALRARLDDKTAYKEAAAAELRDNGDVWPFAPPQAQNEAAGEVSA